MDQNKFYSLVIPMFNEEGNAGLLIDKIRNAMTGFRYELILIDDASSDGTVKEIKEKNDPNVVLIELKKNYGQSSAMMAGFDYASGDYVITLDGDLQNDPTDIPAMVELLENGNYDLVVGKRQKRKDSSIRTIPSKIANFIIKKTTKLNISDQGCALKVFTKDTAKELNLYGENHRFISLMAHLNGAKIAEMPVKHHARQFGVSKYGMNRTFKVINDLLLVLFNQKYLSKPIYLFGNIGLITFSIGVLINIYLLIVKILGYDIGGRPLLILGVLLIFIGIQFFTTGIIIDMLMKTYYESQDKRPFNIRNITDFGKTKA
ncbi:MULTISPECIES: glycosyltransferase family 2 protein [Epilithonimonas]|uniref:Glycosyltransferase n=2 Tax=Epilithonimonas TaxID=2782229 RepID=A0A1H6JTB7_9FLAO|nr:MULTISPECIES: glycosyltransferase family 2 protein [Epilithonimonas]AZI56429.1 glycosyltransferase [Epilithonimonas vandammei]ROI13553.1 glycosyltransferase [Epilithonimonas hominis]SEH63175.1 Glycosyltransferase involved in cell wall bisynthesis [Epilithonimonas hominis]HAP95647.1 glycosyltransferase [Chryseobacterium sp.]